MDKTKETTYEKRIRVSRLKYMCTNIGNACAPQLYAYAYFEYAYACKKHAYANTPKTLTEQKNSENRKSNDLTRLEHKYKVNLN